MHFVKQHNTTISLWDSIFAIENIHPLTKHDMISVCLGVGWREESVLCVCIQMDINK